MSLDPNKSSRSSKSASSSPKTEAQAHPAPEPSSSAETMTDQPSNATLATPPTRMTSSNDAASKPNASAAATSKSTTSPDASVSTDSESRSQPDQAEPIPDNASPPAPPESNAEHQSARNQPIPPASEPMQYRAIGLVRGKYTPSAEQFTRGFILTDDEVLIDAVLLGRVMSLVKKHINLDESHLWVVYPRTREKDMELHMQIVGVWEPEKLNRSDSSSDEEADLDDMDTDDVDTIDVEADDLDEADAELEPDQASDAASAATANPEVPQAVKSDTAHPDQVVPASDLDDRYFSVRGEVVYQSEEEERILVKIRRAPKPGSTQAKAFKVALKGVLASKALGYFWDLQVQRDNKDLVIKESSQIGMVPPQKRTGGGKPPYRGGRGGPRREGGQFSGPPRKRWQEREGVRPQRSGDRPTASAPRQPISKPVKRREKDEES